MELGDEVWGEEREGGEQRWREEESSDGGREEESRDGGREEESKRVRGRR